MAEKRQDQMIERMNKYEDLLNCIVASVDGLADVVNHFSRMLLNKNTTGVW